MAVYSNLTVDQGTDFTMSVDVTDTDGDALNLTGFTVAGQVRRSYFSTTAVNAGGTKTRVLEGQLEIMPAVTKI